MESIFRAFGFWALFISISLAGTQPETPRAISLDDIGLEADLSDPRISPDGRSVVVVVRRPDYEENQFRNQLVLVTVEDGSSRLLTFDRYRVQHPRWSPSGDRLAFLALGSDKKTQVFVLPIGGGEARAVTSAPEGVRQFAWRPDGRSLAYAAEEKAEEETGEEKHNKSFKVGRDVFLASSASRPVHLWVVDLSGTAPDQMTSDEGGLNVYFGGSAFDWSPDGRKLCYVSQPLPHSGETMGSSIGLFEIESRERRVLVPGPAALFGCQFSSDGEWVAFSRPRGPFPAFYPSSLFRVRADGGSSPPPEDLAPDIDRDLDGHLMEDGRTVLLTGPDETRISAWIQTIGGAHRKLELGEVQVAEANVGKKGQVALIGRKPHRADEIYWLESGEDEPRRIGAFNSALASRRLGRVETVHWDGPDGFRQNGVLIYPPDFQPGRKYPLVLAIHGGPMGTSTVAFRASYQVMAAQGWLIFSPNYRGSNNMGTRFQSAVINDAGEGPGRDVMSGVEELKKRGIVDEDRIAVSGWSYGGYMTTWLIAHYSGWNCAVAGAAVTDWFDWYNLADLNNWSGYGLGGSPWLNDNIENYWRQSPIAYAPQIRTPTLILSNTLDPRVTVTQSFKLYYALRDNHVPVEFVAYPIPGHFPQDPVHQKDVYSRWTDWIARHFSGGATPGD